jgi:hypothetical protein
MTASTLNGEVTTQKSPDNVFLLALSGGSLTAIKKYVEGNWTQRNLTKSFKFYNKDSGSYFYHPHMLFSAFHMKPVLKGRTIWEVLEINKNEPRMVFIDSGGYSIATGAVAIDKWTNKQAFDLSVANGNLFPILDIPVTPTADFDRHLAISKKSAQYYKDNKPNEGEIILNVAHGRHMGEVKRWIDDISEVELDGWALGSSHRGNPKEILKGMFYMLTSGVLDNAKAFHVFGVSSASMIIYFAAVKHAIKRNNMKYNFDLTFDSSYPMRTFAFGHFFAFRKFDGFVNVTLTNTVDWSTLKDDDFDGGFFCNCPVCSDLKSFPNLMKDPKSDERGMWGSLHNLHEMLMYKRQIEAMVEMCMDVDGLVHSIFPAAIARNILVIQEAFNNISVGEEIINRKFEYKDIDEATSLEGFFG